MTLAHLTSGSGLFDGLVHPVLGPDHLLAFLIVGVLACAFKERVALWTFPAVFVGSLLIGGIVGMLGVPVNESLVAGSLPFLGLLLVLSAAIAWMPRFSFAAAALATIAILHGLAHGSEVPDAANPALYALGFLATTAALHFIGAFAIGPVVNRYRVTQGLTGLAVGAAGFVLLA